MTTIDLQGNALSGADADAAARYSEAVASFARFTGDPLTAAGTIIESRPDCVMAHALKAWLCLLSTEPAGSQPARDALSAAERLPATPRERGHLVALAHLADGRWHDASATMETLSAEYPRDLLALIAGHQIDFFTGNARLLRDRVGRALEAWDDAPGRHAVLGMSAFGLEECGEYGEAERRAQIALDLEPRDGWARHAVAHVLEMQGRHDEGIAFMRGSRGVWSADSFLAVHNTWHLALYHLEAGEIDEVLALLDGSITGAARPQMMDLVDASAMLWRLHLRGVALRERWLRLVSQYEAIWAPGCYAFNDLHAVMAFIGAGRRDLLAATIAAQKAALRASGDNRIFVRDVGLPLIEGFRAFGEGRYGDAVRSIAEARPIAIRFGGSNAQRDVIDLTLTEAALRAGERDLARGLTTERLRTKPESPLAGLLARRAGAAAVA